jgi:signal transduction histidine kinase
LPRCEHRQRRSHQSKSRLEIRISDNGTGVPDQELEQLFKRFYRAEDSRARLNGGSGLGLAIAKAIVEAHGGQIRAGRADMGGLEISIHF